MWMLKMMGWTRDSYELFLFSGFPSTAGFPWCPHGSWVPKYYYPFFFYLIKILSYWHTGMSSDSTWSTSRSGKILYIYQCCVQHFIHYQYVAVQHGTSISVEYNKSTLFLLEVVFS